MTYVEHGAQSFIAIAIVRTVNIAFLLHSLLDNLRILQDAIVLREVTNV